jgi:hypothetical protein
MIDFSYFRRAKNHKIVRLVGTSSVVREQEGHWGPECPSTGTYIRLGYCIHVRRKKQARLLYVRTPTGTSLLVSEISYRCLLVHTGTGTYIPVPVPVPVGLPVWEMTGRASKLRGVVLLYVRTRVRYYATTVCGTGTPAGMVWRRLSA